MSAEFKTWEECHKVTAPQQRAPSPFWALVRRLRAADAWCIRGRMMDETEERRLGPATLGVVLDVAGLRAARTSDYYIDRKTLERAVRLALPHRKGLADWYKLKPLQSAPGMTRREVRYAVRANR